MVLIPKEDDPVVSYVYASDPLLPEVIVDRGELTPESPVLQHILDRSSNLIAGGDSVSQNRLHSKLTLVGFGPVQIISCLWTIACFLATLCVT